MAPPPPAVPAPPEAPAPEGPLWPAPDTNGELLTWMMSEFVYPSPPSPPSKLLLLLMWEDALTARWFMESATSEVMSRTSASSERNTLYALKRSMHPKIFSISGKLSSLSEKFPGEGLAAPANCCC